MRLGSLLPFLLSVAMGLAAPITGSVPDQLLDPRNHDSALGKRACARVQISETHVMVCCFPVQEGLDPCHIEPITATLPDHQGEEGSASSEEVEGTGE